jgi:4'-phosphopantetheinyl transferase
MSNSHHLWLSAPTNLNVSPDEVHVWRFQLDCSEAQLQHLTQTLSSDEIARAERFYFPEHRQRFIAGRGILRTILGRYLGIAPDQVSFKYEPRGKPVLADTLNESGLGFNLSHSQSLALCAVTNKRLIGVDLENIRPMDDVEALAKRFFLPREYEFMRSLPDSQKQEVFFRYWTCKEAYLKATGEGLAKLEQVEISLTSTEAATLQTSENWRLFELVPANNYLAAVVVAGQGVHLKYWQY